MAWRYSEGERRFHVFKSVSLMISFLLFVPGSGMSGDFAPLPLQNRRRNRVQVWGGGSQVSRRVPGMWGFGGQHWNPPGLSQAVQQDSSSLMVVGAEPGAPGPGRWGPSRNWGRTQESVLRALAVKPLGVSEGLLPSSCDVWHSDTAELF